MLVHTSKLSTRKAKAEGHKFQVSLGYIIKKGGWLKCWKTVNHAIRVKEDGFEGKENKSHQ